MPCSGLHPQGFVVSSVMSFSVQQVCIITPDIPSRFWSIAVILTTPDNQGCVPGWWGDFPQLRLHVTVSRTLPLNTIFDVCREKRVWFPGVLITAQGKIIHYFVKCDNYGALPNVLNNRNQAEVIPRYALKSRFIVVRQNIGVIPEYFALHQPCSEIFSKNSEFQTIW